MSILCCPPAGIQLASDGPELNKRLIYRSTMEQLSAIYAAHGVTSKEDLLLKLLAELLEESQLASQAWGYQVDR